MIKSMTGYGKGQHLCAQGAFIVEMRSLNHKYFDIVVRLPNQLAMFEDRVRDLLKKKVHRGRITLSASWERRRKQETMFSLNLPLAKKYYQELAKLKKSLRLQDDVRLAELIALPEVLTFEQPKDQDSDLWPGLAKAVELALEKLEQMRSAEGKRLQKDLIKRLNKTDGYVRNIENHLPKVIEKYKDSLFKKVKYLSGAKNLDHDRIAEEVALFVRNSDVTEELTRLVSHIKAFRNALANPKEAGKEADFIAQEMFREANTVGAKASSFRISAQVIKMKSQIEKLREQLQNVE
ncbi:MAG: YicC/YloC family endoribonuclease [Candidatus Omnitrophota bacterium]